MPISVRTSSNSGKNVNSRAFLRKFTPEEPPVPCLNPIMPTLAQPPVPIGALQPSFGERALLKLVGRLNAGWLLNALNIIKPLAAQTFDFVPYSPLFNVTGQPAMSVPLYWNEAGLPVGMQFVGRFGDEAMLFRLGGQLERAQPWSDRVPAGLAA